MGLDRKYLSQPICIPGCDLAICKLCTRDSLYPTFSKKSVWVKSKQTLDKNDVVASICGNNAIRATTRGWWQKNEYDIYVVKK